MLINVWINWKVIYLFSNTFRNVEIDIESIYEFFVESMRILDKKKYSTSLVYIVQYNIDKNTSTINQRNIFKNKT